MLDSAGIIIGAALSAVCGFFAAVFLKVSENGRYTRALCLKGAAGLCFCVLGAVMTGFGADAEFSRRVLVGLLLGLVGDELLALRFIYDKRKELFFALGACFFALGHGMYIWALFSLCALSAADVLPITLLFAAAAIVFAFIMKTNPPDSLALPGAVYLFLVSLMAGTAFTAAMHLLSMGALFFAVAGILFAVSDNVLCAYTFGRRRTPGMNLVVHATYYSAQLLIAWSVALM